MAVPSDHVYGDNHNKIINLKKKKKIFGKATAASSVALRGLSKADAGRGSNTEPGIAKPVAPFHHSHRAAVNNLLQINTPL